MVVKKIFPFLSIIILEIIIWIIIILFKNALKVSFIAILSQISRTDVIGLGIYRASLPEAYFFINFSVFLSVFCMFIFFSPSIRSFYSSLISYSLEDVHFRRRMKNGNKKLIFSAKKSENKRYDSSTEKMEYSKRGYKIKHDINEAINSIGGDGHSLKFTHLIESSIILCSYLIFILFFLLFRNYYIPLFSISSIFLSGLIITLYIFLKYFLSSRAISKHRIIPKHWYFLKFIFSIFFIMLFIPLPISFIFHLKDNRSGNQYEALNWIDKNINKDAVIVETEFFFVELREKGYNHVYHIDYISNFSSLKIEYFINLQYWWNLELKNEFLAKSILVERFNNGIGPVVEIYLYSP